MKPVLYGADYSVYVRIARLALVEKGVEHDLVPLDIFAKDGPPDWYAALHPFRKIPAFEHDGLRLFETSTITRYVDEAFAGPALQPADVRERAAMNQIIGLLDAYAYRAMVWGIYVETVSKPRAGESTDPSVVDAAISITTTCLATLEQLKRNGPWLLGEHPTLADFHAAPMFGYFTKAELSTALLGQWPELSAWWRRISARPSFAETEPTS